MSKQLASQVYASSQGAQCCGPVECHFCSAPCKRLWNHDDPVGPFCRVQTTARRPANPYVCVGCWLFRRRSTTIWYIGGTFKDRQTPCENSWWMVDGHALGIKEGNAGKLYESLLDPPLRFVLSLKTEEDGRKNFLHLMECNDHQEIRADTELKFTLNCTPLTYTIYELEQGLRQGPEGLNPGVGVLLRFLGPRENKLWTEVRKEPIKETPEEKNKGGRPKKEDLTLNKRLVKKVS